MADQTPFIMAQGVLSDGSSTKANTTSGCMRMAINPPIRAPAIMEEVGGKRLKAIIITKTSGIRVSRPMSKMLSIISRATVRSIVTSTVSVKPMTAYIAMAMRMEGIGVDIMFLMCVIKS